MNVNIKFTGVVEKILDEAVRSGLTSTKTEALRLGVLELENKYKLLESIEDSRDIAKADLIMERVSKGKEKLYSEKEILKTLNK